MVDDPSAAAGSAGSAESGFQRARGEWAYVVLSDLVGCQIWLVRTRSALLPQVPSRRPPPSVAASDAENAPMISAAVSQSASWAAFLRVLSRPDLTWLVTSVTRFSASGWLRPVRADTTLAT